MSLIYHFIMFIFVKLLKNDRFKKIIYFISFSLILFLLIFYSPKIYSNILGSDFQNFNPISSGIDFVTVHSSETLEPGIINLGIFYNQAFNTLPVYESDNDELLKQDDSVSGLDLNIGLGLTKNWEIGFNFPQIVDQTISNKDALPGYFTDYGSTEIRVNSKYRLVNKRNFGIALMASANFDFVKNSPYVGDGAGPSLNLELIFDTTIKKTSLAFNLGHRWRDQGETISDQITPPPNSLIASIAASYHLKDLDSKIICEFFGSVPTEKKEERSDKSLSNLEALLGIKYDINNSIAFHLGGTKGIIDGTASPDWRYYLGLNWAIGPLFGKSQEPKVKYITRNIRKKRTPPKEETFTLYDIHFETDSHTKVYGKVKKYLHKLAQYIKQPPGYQMIIFSGHTDSVGSSEYNIKLSHKRASSIAKYLIKNYGIDASKVQIEAHGEDMPIADNSNYQGRKKNRRVELTIYR